MNKVKNHLLFLLYTVILGMIVGAIVWGFLRVMNLGIDFLWSFLPSQISFPLYTLCVCALGGLLIGLWKRKFGDYPEELGTVLGTVKNASVGPEAGLTGVIAGLCTWVGDKLKRFKREVEDLTAIGLSATLGTVFRSPMFGFVEPIESDKDTVLPKTSKIVLYFTAILSSLGVFILLNKLFGISVGMESMAAEKTPLVQYLFAIPLTLAGIAAGWLYFLFKKLTGALARRFGKYVVLRAVTGGILLGVSGTFLPLTMFSGEHQIELVMENTEATGAVLLIVTAVIKLLLTNICIDSGLKGGHFFPVIFCGVAIGCAMSLLSGVNAVLCAAVVTTALVGHTLKKPLATVLLLMIVFPPKLIPVMLCASAASRFIPTPKRFLTGFSSKK